MKGQIQKALEKEKKRPKPLYTLMERSQNGCSETHVIAGEVCFSLEGLLQEKKPFDW